MVFKFVDLAKLKNEEYQLKVVMTGLGLQYGNFEVFFDLRDVLF
jgi:hypothetical protein